MSQVSFTCQVKQVQSKTLGSGDQGFTIVLIGEDPNMLVPGGFTGQQLVKVTIEPIGTKDGE